MAELDSVSELFDITAALRASSEPAGARISRLYIKSRPFLIVYFLQKVKKPECKLRQAISDIKIFDFDNSKVKNL